jgi:cytochrome c oxidase subunit IV
MTGRESSVAWIILLALTAWTFSFAETPAHGSAVLVPVLLATLLKGRIVIDRFMALQRVGAPWRWIVLGWLAMVLGLIAYAFSISQN